MNLQNKYAATHPEIEANDNWAEAFAGSEHTDVWDFTMHNAACTAAVTAWLDKFTPETFLTMLLCCCCYVGRGGVHLDATDLAAIKVHNVMDLAGAAKQMFEVMAAAAAETGLPAVLVNGAAMSADTGPEKAATTAWLCPNPLRAGRPSWPSPTFIKPSP